nr:MAG TPA: hypothetical protein [Caudoviricetes sp.]
MFLSATGRASGFKISCIRNKYAAAVSRCGKRGRNAGKLAVIPLGAMIEADLTKELIFLTRAGLSKLFKEEVALAGNGLEHRGKNVEVQQQRSAAGQVFTEVQVNNAYRGNDARQRDTVDLTRRRNYRQAVLHRISVDLEHGSCIAPQAQAGSGRILAIDFLDHICDIPQAKRLGCHCLGVGSDSRNETTGLVDLAVIGGLVIYAVNEGVLDIGIDLHHLCSNLKIELVHGVSLLIGNIDAAQSAHVRLLCIRDAYAFLKDLSNVRFLLTSYYSRIGRSKRCGLADSRLSTATGSKLLTGNKLNVIGCLCSAAYNRRQRSSGVALVKKHSGVVKYPKTCSKSICHNWFSPLFILNLRLRLSFKARVIRSRRKISGLLRV